MSFAINQIDSITREIKNYKLFQVTFEHISLTPISYIFSSIHYKDEKNCKEIFLTLLSWFTVNTVSVI